MYFAHKVQRTLVRQEVLLAPLDESRIFPSITASALSVFPPGQEAEATDYIYNIWTNLKNSDVF